MFNKDFYPTPEDICIKMISPYDLNQKNILEPSAGKGDLIKVINKFGGNTYYCEIEPLLQKTLLGLGTFLNDNFLKLTQEQVSHIDYIFMNPPFSSDEDHILHAYNIAPPGCTIVSLCNAFTVERRITRKRSELGNIIDNHGNFQNIGNVFNDAERTTMAEIGLVTIIKEVGVENDWSDYFDIYEENEDQYNGIMSYDAIRECVNRYVGACKLFDKVAENAIQMNKLAGVFGVRSLSFTLNIDEKEKNISQFKVDLRKLAWNWIFTKLNLEKYMTQGLKNDLNKFVETQRQIPFTMKNIHKMLDVIVQTHGQRINKAVCEVFDAFTRNHHDNRFMVEGWKTNSHYMINKKIIVPYIGEQGRWNGYPEVAYGNSSYNNLIDFQKCLCALTGVDFNTIPNLQHGFFSPEYSGYGNDKKMIREAKTWGEWYDWGFFEIKIFKKGTLHMKFKDLDVWAIFNRKYAEINGFELPNKF